MDRICVRERASFRNALSIGIKRKKLVLAADLALHFAERKCSTTSPATGRTILLSPRYTKKRKGSFLPSWIKRKIARKSFDPDFHASVLWFADLLKQLCKACNVIMLPVYQGADTSSQDRLFVQRIVEAAGLPDHVEIYEGPMTSDAILRLMGKIDAAVAVPLHAITMAALAYKPVIPLPYASKCTHLMSELRLTTYGISLSGQSTDFDIRRILEGIQDCMQSGKHTSSIRQRCIHALLCRHQKNIASIRSVVSELASVRE